MFWDCWFGFFSILLSTHQSAPTSEIQINCYFFFSYDKIMFKWLLNLCGLHFCPARWAWTVAVLLQSTREHKSQIKENEAQHKLLFCTIYHINLDQIRLLNLCFFSQFAFHLRPFLPLTCLFFLICFFPPYICLTFPLERSQTLNRDFLPI